VKFTNHGNVRTQFLVGRGASRAYSAAGFKLTWLEILQLQLDDFSDEVAPGGTTFRICIGSLDAKMGLGGSPGVLPEFWVPRMKPQSRSRSPAAGRKGADENRLGAVVIKEVRIGRLGRSRCGLWGDEGCGSIGHDDGGFSNRWNEVSMYDDDVAAYLPAQMFTNASLVV